MNLTSDCFNKQNLDLFWKFICERQLVWNKRFIQKLKSPWTEDKVLQEERFTNIYRELDPGTQYAINSILETNNPKQDKIFNIMIYRLIGKSETHKELGFQKLNTFNKIEFENKLKFIRDIKKQPIFTAAYMVSGYKKFGFDSKIKNVSIIFDKLCKNFNSFYSNIANAKSSEEVYKIIKSQDGFGNFLSYQVLVDLLYPLKFYNNQPLLHFSNNDWSSPGPGAKIGIKLILENNLKANPLDVIIWLRDNQETEFARLNLDFKYLLDSKGNKIKLSLANIQNCLCEFHKYIKISNNTGRGRRKFTSSKTAQ